MIALTGWSWFKPFKSNGRLNEIEKNYCLTTKDCFFLIKAAKTSLRFILNNQILRTVIYLGQNEGVQNPKWESFHPINVDFPDRLVKGDVLYLDRIIDVSGFTAW